MSIYKRISKVYENAPRISFQNTDKFVLMSDLHRSNGSYSDSFLPNQNIIMAALRTYLAEGFTYIELGDGDELWMNKSMKDIKEVNRPVFQLLKEFYEQNRLHMIYGNHDIKKRTLGWRKKNLSTCPDGCGLDNEQLFSEIEIPEGIVLEHQETGRDILLLHGHQADFLNYTLWRLAKFLVRYIWQPLSLIGIKDPTSASDSGHKKERIDQMLTDWAVKEGRIIIAGHTHRAIFPETGTPGYFNDGCCVHPRYITAIEIAGRQISLVKWHVRSRERDNTLYVVKEVMLSCFLS